MKLVYTERPMSGVRPDSRGTFFCFAKRKYPKKRRPSVSALRAYFLAMRQERLRKEAQTPCLGPAGYLRNASRHIRSRPVWNSLRSNSHRPDIPEGEGWERGGRKAVLHPLSEPEVGVEGRLFEQAPLSPRPLSRSEGGAGRVQPSGKSFLWVCLPLPWRERAWGEGRTAKRCPALPSEPPNVGSLSRSSPGQKHGCLSANDTLLLAE